MATFIHTTKSIIHVDDAHESPDGVHYIEVFDLYLRSIGYWTVDEISEDPVLVLGAIFGAIKSGTPLGKR